MPTPGEDQKTTPNQQAATTATEAQKPSTEAPKIETPPKDKPPTQAAEKKAPKAETKTKANSGGLFSDIKETFFGPSKPKTDTSKAAVNNESKTKKSTSSQLKPDEKKALLDAEKQYQAGLASILDLIAPSAMNLKHNHMQIGGLFSQSFYVYAYPRYIEANWLSPIINFDATMDISQFIYPIESSAIMRILKKKVAQMQSTIRMESARGQVRDPAIETALQDAEELRTQLQRGEEKFFQFALYLTVYSDDEKKLAKIGKQLESLLGSKLVLTKRADLRMEQALNSCLPLCSDELEVTRNMNTTPLASTFPFSSSDLTSNEGILYGVNRHNDSLVIFDRFKLENANSVIFATSGAGKSYTIKLEILRYMMLGTDVIVIDPENEYEALANTVGGSYLRISLNSNQRLNPFDLPPPIEGEEVQPGDILRGNIITLHGLMKIMMGGVTPSEEGILDRALIDTYALKGITMDVIDPSEFEMPTMMDLYNILSTMEGAQSLSERLHKYTHGTYSGIFNQQSNVDIHTGLMIFCIRDLEDSLRPIAMYIILNYIWNKVRSKLKRRLLVIDEAWSLMQHEDSAKFLFGLVKRARKYYLGITTITQDVEDFVKNQYGKPIVTNSAMQILLKQSPAAIDNVVKMFNLTEGERYLLLNSAVGQGLFFAGLKHVALQIIASYTEDKLITTNPEEILSTQAQLAEFEGAEEAGGAEAIPEATPAPTTTSESVEAQVLADENIPDAIKAATKEITNETAAPEAQTTEPEIEITPTEPNSATPETIEETKKSNPEIETPSGPRPTELNSENVEYGNELPMFRDQKPEDLEQ